MLNDDSWEAYIIPGPKMRMSLFGVRGYQGKGGHWSGGVGFSSEFIACYSSFNSFRVIQESISSRRILPLCMDSVSPLIRLSKYLVKDMVRDR